MSIEHLDKLFDPRSVAVVGASDQAGKVGHRVMRNLREGGYEGRVVPINPGRATVMGVEAYPSLTSMPEPVDLAVLATPAASVPGLIESAGRAGVKALILLSAGYAETGQAGRALEQQVHEAASRYPGMRLLGPNCLGVIVPHRRLNASFAGASPLPGHIAFVSQSGALCTSVLDWALDRGVGFSHFISIGNQLDIHFADLIDYLGQSDRVRSIMLYIESIRDARRFMSAARAFARTKPIIAYKAGRFAESASAAASHTGAMAGEDDVFDAAFRRAGVERVYTLDDMFECAELLAHHGRPKGVRLAIVTNAGGPGVMATDALMARGGTMARLHPDTLAALSEALPACWSHGNPVDLIGDATPQRYARAVERVLMDEGVDAVLVLLTPQAMTDPTGCAHAVAHAACHQGPGAGGKPVLGAWMGGASVQEGRRLLNAGGVPTYDSPDRAVNAFMHLVSYARNLETLYETPREISSLFDLQLNVHRHLGDELISSQTPRAMGERAAKRVLELYKIPTPPTLPADSPELACAHAARLGYPVVLKIDSDQVLHKSDVGGVALGLEDEAAVKSAFDRLMDRAQRAVAPEPFVGGVSVQPMVRLDHPVELILGMKRDATFGVVILLGSGGVTTEIDRDRALGLPPLNERLARQMIRSLRCYPLLKGYRDRPPLDLDALIDTVVRFSYLVADHPTLREFDINPLLVGTKGVMALDARMVIDAGPPASDRPFAHLAIRPYPEGLRHAAVLKDGTPVTLRPIRPEDEPLWHEMVDACSPESIRSRFFTYINEFTHEMATRYCCIDYDRELAIVAELTHNDRKRLIGVGRLIADPGRHAAEYAVIVIDEFIRRGLGLLLTDFCLEIAKDWGVQRVHAVTHADNLPMLATLRNYRFELTLDDEDQLVYAHRDL